MSIARPPLYRSGSWRTTVPIGVAVVCFVVAGLAVYARVQQGYRIVELDREESWLVRLEMDVEATDQDVFVRAMLPERVSGRQRVFDLYLLSDVEFRATQEEHSALWERSRFSGRARLVMSFRAQTEARQYSLPAVLDWDDVRNRELGSYLVSDELTQSDHPDIRAHGEALRGASDDVIGFVKNLFQYVQDDVGYREGGGATDAVTAFRLGEASCNGKNRLFVALARSQGIPARLVKGLILEKGVVKQVSHAWSTLYLNGQWIPFCPTNHHFAFIPATYLEYPKVDERMFHYSKSTRFSARFLINRGVRTPEEAFRADLDNPHHILAPWGSLGEAQFSLSLLMVILTVPVGVTVVTFLRNVVGLVPFGTFLPALIAVSFRDTGLGWGLAMFCVTLGLGAALNELLRLFHLLHFPRLSVIFCFVVVCILGLAVLATHFHETEAAKVGMFPLAILTLTIERFTLGRERESFKSVLLRLGVTLVAAALCYAVMMDFRVRSAILVFPELILVCVGLNLLMGIYTGLRWTEYLRFRLLAKEGEP